MPEIKIIETVDNSNVAPKLQETKRQFENLQKSLENLDFKSLNQKQINSFSDQIQEEVKRLKEAVKEYETQINNLKAQQKSLQDSGDFLSAGAMNNEIRAVQNSITAYNNKIGVLESYRDKLMKAEEALSKKNKTEKEAEPIMVRMLGGQKNYNQILSLLPTGLKKAIDGINKMTTAGLRFIATPLGATLAALILAYKAISTWLHKSAEGQEALAKVSGLLEGVMNVLKDVVMSVGRALYKAFTEPKQAVIDLWESIKTGLLNRIKAAGGVFVSFGKVVTEALHGNFKEAGDAAKELANNYQKIFTGKDAKDIADGTRAVFDRIKATSELKEREHQLHKDRIAWSEEDKRLEAEIAKERNTMRTGTNAQRKAASANVIKLEEQRTAQELKFAKEELAIQEERNKLHTSSQEDLDKEAQLRAKVQEIEAKGTRAKGAALRTEAKVRKQEESAAQKAAKEAEQRVKKEEELQNELNAIVLDNEQARLDLMDDGTKKEVIQIRQNYEKRREEIRKQAAKWKRLNKEAGITGLGEDGLTDSQRTAINAANKLNEAKAEKANEEIARRNREEYLKEYGTYQEKKLAINEEYMRKWLATDDEFERKRLGKERDKNLEALERQYNANYALIFADAGALSDNLLVRAIEATQKEIDKAQKDGDIEKLTSLYANLKAQLTEQSSRENWGFVGLAQAFKDLAKAREDLENAKDTAEQNKALETMERLMSEISRRGSEIKGVFTELGSQMQGMGGRIGEIGSGISELGGAAQKITEVIGQQKAGISMNKGSAITFVLQSAIELAGMLVNSIQANKKAQEEWNRTLRQSEHELTMLNLEALDYKEQNIFGIENPYKKAIDGAKQYSEAMKALQEQTSKLVEGGKVQTGTKKAINWSNVGKGAAIGAAAGAVAGAGIFSGITTAAGAAIGAAAGIITGLLSTKVVPVFKTLQEKYGTVVNDAFELNPQIIADYDKLDADTKKLVDNWKEIKAKAEEAEAQMRETFKNLAGDVGNQLSDSLVEAFTNGKLNSAIDDFHDKMNDTIEDIIEQMVFSNVFSEMFDNLQKEMEESFKGPNADENIVDDLIRFEEAYKNGLEEYEKQMEDARAYMQSAGFKDAFTNDTQRAGLSQGVATASQDSIDVLSGMMTVVQGHTFEIKESLTGFSAQYETLIANTAAMLEHTQGIHVDTTEIKEIQAQIAELSRSINSNVSTIVDRGVTMRG